MLTAFTPRDIHFFATSDSSQGLTEQEACAKAGHKSHECRVQLIPEQIIVTEA